MLSTGSPQILPMMNRSPLYEDLLGDEGITPRILSLALDLGQRSVLRFTPCCKRPQHYFDKRLVGLGNPSGSCEVLPLYRQSHYCIDWAQQST